MINANSYLLDDSIIIRSSNEMYRFGHFNGFWEWLNKGIRDGHIIILQSVYDKLDNNGNNMELSRWCEDELYQNLFNELNDNKIKTNIKKIANYIHDVVSNVYDHHSVDSWMNSTGQFLIATAMVYKCVIVTGNSSDLFNHGEINQTDITTDDEISTHDIANHFNVHCINLYDLEDKFNLQLN